MASDNLKGILFALVLFSLFSFLMIYGAVQLGANYGKSASEIGDGALNDTAFYESIEEVDSSADNYRARFEEGDTSDVDDARGIFTVATDMISLITAPFRLLATVLDNILKTPPIVTSIILGLVAISLILAIWRLIRIGD
jgi:hypothetical protein